jgi:hypothetical protein
VVEAGLGRGHRDFHTIRLHTLPGNRTAAEIWKAASAQEDLTSRAAYRQMLHEGALDRCGVTLLAGKAVGDPSSDRLPPASSSARCCACSMAARYTSSSISTSKA